MNATEPWWFINFGSGNGLVQLGNKPLAEPMLTHYVSTYGITRSQSDKKWLPYDMYHDEGTMIQSL